MIVAMDVGMLAYHNMIKPPLMALGLEAVFAGDLGYTWMLLSMVVGMVALMRATGHSWRMANEMAIGMVAPVVACFAVVRLGICPLVAFLAWLTEANVHDAAHTAMLLGMLAVVALRRGMYGLRASVDGVHAHAALLPHAKGAG